MQSRHVVRVEDYEPYIGAEAVDRLLAKGRRLAGRRRGGDARVADAPHARTQSERRVARDLGAAGLLHHQTADRIVRLLSDESLRRRMGEAVRERVLQHYLMTRYLEQYLDLFPAFETSYRLRPPALEKLTQRERVLEHVSVH